MKLSCTLIGLDRYRRHTAICQSCFWLWTGVSKSPSTLFCSILNFFSWVLTVTVWCIESHAKNVAAEKTYKVPLEFNFSTIIQQAIKALVHWWGRRVLSHPPGFHSHCGLPNPNGMSFKGWGQVHVPGEFGGVTNPQTWNLKRTKSALCGAAPRHTYSDTCI